MERWTAQRKFELLEGLRTGKISREAAMKLHGLTPEELAEWEGRLQRYGIAGLHSTKIQMYPRGGWR